MSEFYLDERPKPQDPSQWGTGAITPIDFWRVNWRPAPSDPSDPSDPSLSDLWYLLSSWGFSQTAILLNGDGFLQGCDPWILKGDKGCMELKIEAQIQGDSGGAHIRCILLTFTMSERTGSTNNPFDWLFGNVPVIDGTMTIRAKFQAGHWDYVKLNTVRFRILDELTTPWIKLPLGNPYVDVATIDIVHGQFIINSLRLR